MIPTYTTRSSLDGTFSRIINARMAPLEAMSTDESQPAASAQNQESTLCAPGINRI